MEYYLLVKNIHMTAALLSFAGFILRSFWMLKSSPILHLKPVKVLPHIIDTVLLAAAIYLVIASGLYPFVVNWVTAKVVLLVVYIVAGTIALKRGKTRKIRLLAMLISLAAIISIFAIAISKPAFLS